MISTLGCTDWHHMHIVHATADYFWHCGCACTAVQHPTQCVRHPVGVCPCAHLHLCLFGVVIVSCMRGRAQSCAHSLTPCCRSSVPALGAQVSCDRFGRVVNVSLASPDELSSQYPELQALTQTPGLTLDEGAAVQQLNDPTLWEAVTAVQRAWPAWHYRTQGLVLRQLPCGEPWIALGRASLQGLYMDNAKCGQSLMHR